MPPGRLRRISWLRQMIQRAARRRQRARRDRAPGSAVRFSSLATWWATTTRHASSPARHSNPMRRACDRCPSRRSVAQRRTSGRQSNSSARHCAGSVAVDSRAAIATSGCGWYRNAASRLGGMRSKSATRSHASTQPASGPRSRSARAAGVMRGFTSISAANAAERRATSSPGSRRGQCRATSSARRWGAMGVQRATITSSPRSSSMRPRRVASASGALSLSASRASLKGPVAHHSKNERVVVSVWVRPFRAKTAATPAIGRVRR